MQIYVNLAQIDDNPFQQRVEYGDVAELAADIHRHKLERPDTLGLQQVPSGRLVGDDGDLVPVAGLDVEEWLNGFILRPGWRVQLEFGHRRRRAFAYLLEQGAVEYFCMPITIRDLDDDAMLDGVWSENRARRDLSAVEEAQLLKLKIDRLGAGHKEVAEAWGLARSTVTNRLSLLELPEALQKANREGVLSERQCLSLAPIARMATVNGVQWGDEHGRDIGRGWGVPAGPETVIQKAIENPEAITSDVIREQSKRMLEHAGTAVPDAIAKHDYCEIGGLVQAQCKGCSCRINKHCLQRSCIEVKLQAWPDIILAQFSQETGIPISDRDEDFDHSHDDILRIQKLYEDGETGGGMVCAWKIRKTAARPFPGSRIGMMVFDSDKYELNGRAAIALGYRGFVPGTNEEKKPKYELPTIEEIEAWEKQAVQILNQTKIDLMEALVDKLLGTIADWDVIQGMINSPSLEWVDDPEKLASAFARWLLEKGNGVRNAYYILDQVIAYQVGAARAGLSSHLLGDLTATLRKTAVLILNDWYEFHEYPNSWEEHGEKALKYIEEWEKHSAGILEENEDLKIMHQALERARVHIQQKLEDAVQREEDDD
jgi:hypothetical protein